MPISCECPECGKRLKAADSAAGKKAVCPGCGAAVRIPLPESPDLAGDEFNIHDVDVSSGIDEIVDDRVPCPMCGEMIKPEAVRCRHCGENLKSARRKGRRSGHDPSMPVTVIVSIVIEGLFIAFNALGILGNLMQSNFPGACGSVFRIAVNVIVLIGLIQRKATIRTTALALDAIGMVFMLSCGGILLSGVLADQPQLAAFKGGAMMGILIAVLVIQTVLYIVQIGVLLPTSSSEYLDQ
jgi:hypothetical protein